MAINNIINISLIFNSIKALNILLIMFFYLYKTFYWIIYYLSRLIKIIKIY